MSNSFPHLRILAIETSCDDTGIAIIRTDSTWQIANGRSNETQIQAEVTIVANELASQQVHAAYGGVFPTVAKREHAKALVPLLKKALERHPDWGGTTQDKKTQDFSDRIATQEQREHLTTLLAREPELLEDILAYAEKFDVPRIDAIAVTVGPGLEPCLWVGINCAKALSYLWGVPVVAVNHMEGHIAAALTTGTTQDKKLETKDFTQTSLNQPYVLHVSTAILPCLSLLISGGHTEFVLSEKEGEYAVIGETRDDAVGECFDKCGRMLELPYPGGPKIGAMAEEARAQHVPKHYTLPRPMLHTSDLDFSFSGLKTAVLLALQRKPADSEEKRLALAREIEDAIVDVLVSKTRHALTTTSAQRLVVSGGVSASNRIRAELTTLIAQEFPDVDLRISPRTLATDNALMIALASIRKVATKQFADPDYLVATGNMRFAASH